MKVSIILLLLVTLSGRQVKAICKCAELFPSEGDIDQATSFNVLNSTSAGTAGQTRIITTMSFHCKGVLMTVKYAALLIECQGMNEDSSGQMEQYPELQLWRRNGTEFQLEKRQNLMPTDQELRLEWNFENDDAIGLWLPSKMTECQYSNQRALKIGYQSGRSSTYYSLEGNVTRFSLYDYTLINGPLPLITVKLDKDLNFICLIGLPVGGLLAILSCCIVCCTIGYSIKRERDNKRHAKGALIITHTSPQYVDEETEMNTVIREQINPYDTIVETGPKPPLPPRNPIRSRPPSYTAVPQYTGGIHRLNRPPNLELQERQVTAGPRSPTTHPPLTTPPPQAGIQPRLRLQSVPLPPTTPPPPDTLPPPSGTLPSNVNSTYVNVPGPLTMSLPPSEPHPYATPTEPLPPPSGTLPSNVNSAYVNVPGLSLPPSGPHPYTTPTEPLPPPSVTQIQPLPIHIEHNPHFDEFDDFDDPDDLPEDEYVLPSDINTSSYANITTHRDSTLF